MVLLKQKKTLAIEKIALRIFSMNTSVVEYIIYMSTQLFETEKRNYVQS